MRRKAAGLLIYMLISASICACVQEKAETKSEPMTETNAPITAEPSEPMEDNSEALFADAFAEFEASVQAGKYEEAYFSAKDAAKYGNINRKVLEQFTSSDDDSIIKLAYIYLCKEDPVAAADCVIDRESDTCKTFLQFIRDNSYVITEYDAGKEDVPPLNHYVYDECGRIIETGNGLQKRTIEYGKNERLERWYEDNYLYQKFDDSGKVVYECENGSTSRNENNYIYDDSDRLIRKEYLLTDNADVYEYDESGNCLAKYEKNGSVYRHEYDEKGREIKSSYERSQNDINFRENTYDDSDRLVKKVMIYSGGSTDEFNYEYDNLGRKVREYGTYYWPSDGFAEFETVYTYSDKNGGYKYITKRSDGEDSHGFRKNNSLGNLIESYDYSLHDSTPPGDVGDVLYPYEPVTTMKPVGQLEPYVSSLERAYDYVFFIKSKEEDEYKNLYQFIAEDMENKKLVPVSEDEVLRYGNIVKIMPECGPCGNFAIKVENTFIYCYELEETVDISDVSLVFKNSKEHPNIISVYAACGEKEKLLGSFGTPKEDFMDDSIVYCSCFSANNNLDIWNFRRENSDIMVIRPAELINYSAEAGTIEADFGTQVELRYGGGAGVIGQDGIFEKMKVSDDVVVVGLDNSIYPSFVTKEFLVKNLGGAQYEVGIVNGVIVYIEAIQSV